MKRLTYWQSVGAAALGGMFWFAIGCAAYSLAALLVKDDSPLGRFGWLAFYLFYAGFAVLCRGSLGHLYQEKVDDDE